MTNGQEGGSEQLTFSQRYGHQPLPEPMRLEHVTQKFKQLIWGVIEQEIQRQSKSRSSLSRNYKLFNNSMEKILFLYRYEVLEWLADDARKVHWDGKGNPDADKSWVKNQISNGQYHEILSLIEFILRQKICPTGLSNNIKTAFDEASIAYFVGDVNGLPTVMPRFSRESGEATKRAIETIREAGMGGAITHLRDASEHIRLKQYGDSIEDSIHTVESVACQIDPKASKTLGPALTSLEKAGLLKHPALKEAFKNLYGYTSDERGIRHALLDQESADVGLDEALFMFGACASFSAYLVNKHRQMNQKEDDGQ